MDVVQSAASFDPSRDRLVPLREITFNGKRFAPGVGGSLPTSGNVERLRQLIRLKMARVETPPPPPPPPPVPEGFLECPECGRGFKTKLNLGAHARSHRLRKKKR